MTPESLRVQTEELWREILTPGVALEVISESAANEIAAALGVG